MNKIEFPQPTDEALTHSQKLVDLIVELIDREGPISFADYWRKVMFEPGLGYYSSGLSKFGQAGDFITAPELGSVFGHCVANQLAQMMADLQNPRIMELGAGTGALAATMLKRLAELQALPETYFILDTSADLRERQRQHLQQHCPEHIDLVVWLDQPPTENWQGIIVGNEVVDALPANRFEYADQQWQQLAVICDEGRFDWKTIPVDDGDQPLLEQISRRWHQKPRQYRTEHQPHLDAWISSLSENLQTGYLLLIDYGYTESEYFHPQRTDGTLICHYRHRAHSDPFIYPGLQDISVSVNFSALADASHTAGFQPLGYISQAQFLLGGGLQELLPTIETMPTADRHRMLSEIKQLTLPSEMGDRFSCLLAGKNVESLPGAFHYNNQLRRL